MKSTYKRYKQVLMLMIVPVLVTSFSCKKFVELDAPENKIAAGSAFQTDITATAAILALYNYGIYNSQVPFQQSLTFFGGISADELHYTLTTAPEITEIENNAISVASVQNATLWANGFSEILAANSAITGLNASTTLTASVKSQLMGEAKFFRAFMNFYLVNIYGDIPLMTGSDALTNAYLPRSSASQVYDLIVSDLKEAQALLPATYVGTLKSRVNQLAATALLARVYLYRKDYANAEAMATQVINSGTYTMAATGSVFLNSSSETILQFATYYGFSSFVQSYRTASSLATVAPPSYVLTSNIASSFEAKDNRKTNWVDSTVSGSKFYRINKYKTYTATAAAVGNEFNVVLRLAEQYLIRAEARAQQNNLINAAADVNVIRSRAGLSNLGAAASASQTAVLAAVAQERKVELFGEYAHRWLDLLRTGQANTVLSVLKPTTWNATRSVLFPVPDAQRQLNTALTQNAGY